MSKQVFFLGAGFSKAMDEKYPLMKDLVGSIKKNLTDISLATHYRKIAPTIKSDIESLLTYLSVDFPWKDDYIRHSDRALYTRIVEIISNNFEQLARQNSSPRAIWQGFANYVKNNVENCNFITLNYDIQLENLLLSAFKKQENDKYEIFSDFYAYPMNYICDRDNSVMTGGVFDDKVPKILKLHGSANWFWAGITPSDNLYYRTWDNHETDKVARGLRPYIIPPVMDKNAFYNHVAIQALWGQAEELLKEAEEIYIIGFSFPETDLSVRYLFRSALKHSKPKIYVINTDKEQSLKRHYKKVFTNKKLDYTYTGNIDATESFITNKLLSD